MLVRPEHKELARSATPVDNHIGIAFGRPE